MFFRKKGIQLKSKNSVTHLILNGVDISKNVLEYKITQEGGCMPKLTITIFEKDLDSIVDGLKNIQIELIDRK